VNGAKQLGEGIARCVTLTSLKLNLINDDIGLEGAKYLGEEIARCVTLTFLDLSLNFNSIGPNGKKIVKCLVIKAKRLI